MYMPHKIQGDSSVVKLPYWGGGFLEKMSILSRLVLDFSAKLSVSWMQ